MADQGIAPWTWDYEIHVVTTTTYPQRAQDVLNQTWLFTSLAGLINLCGSYPQGLVNLMTEG